jgi:uncharacterized protein YndB with AHSA1/START domain
MDVVASLDAPYPIEAVFAAVEELDRYPAWLDIVPRAVGAGARGDDAGPAWTVDLRGRLGPFARSKRLRMVRTEHTAPTHVRFERVEHDGKRHSAWILTADDEATDTGSRLTMRLHYGGSLFGAVLEPVLADEIERSKPRLLALLAR